MHEHSTFHATTVPHRIGTLGELAALSARLECADRVWSGAAERIEHTLGVYRAMRERLRLRGKRQRLGREEQAALLRCDARIEELGEALSEIAKRVQVEVRGAREQTRVVRQASRIDALLAEEFRKINPASLSPVWVVK